jgi:hypothetical protein
MTHRLTTALAGVALVAATSPALAQSDSAVLADPAAVPGMATMDRFDGQTKLATSLSYVGLDSDGFIEDATALHFDLYGQYMAAQGFGGYGVVNINYISANDDSETGIGNLEVGGLYLIPGATPIILRGGLVLATADEDDFLPNAYGGILARFNDLPQNFASTTWLRLSGHPIVRQGNLFFKADVGLDIPIDDDDTGVETLVRLNVGGGIETGGVAIIGELVNVYSTEDADDQLVNTIAITARFMQGGQLQPAVSFVLPLDDEYNDIVDWILILGLEYVLPTAG